MIHRGGQRTFNKTVSIHRTIRVPLWQPPTSPMRAYPLLVLLTATAFPSFAAITFTGIADKGKYTDTITFTVVADTTANTTTVATLDGVALPVSVAKTISNRMERCYHEVAATSRDNTTNAVVSTALVRFVLRDTERRAGQDPGSEDGIPPHTPYKTVNDAPSAFAGQTLKVIVPAAWPANLPVPMAVKLVSGANETVRLGGLVTFSGFPGTTAQMRRGWGSVVAPAKTAAGAVAVGGAVGVVTANPTINIEAAPVFTDVTGAIAANTSWPANSRINITGTLTINAGVTLTVGAGTIVKIYTGNGTAETAAEIVVNGSLMVNGTEANPCAFVPATAGASWGGIEMPNSASNVTANWTLFHGSGEDQLWFNTTSRPTHTGYSSHKDQQALFLVSGSLASGSLTGAHLQLNNCFCFSLAGQVMNSKIRTWLEINRTLMQRAVTCGEQNDCKVSIDRSALMEFPSETSNFVDADNDAIYLTSGDLSITNTVIGYTKDDGVDSGGNGGASPFGTVDPTSGTTTTRYVSTNNWYEGTYHEGNSLSGIRNVYFTGCIFYNCGQGIEAGYSNGASSDGPNAYVDGCLFSSNMVGIRWGDNYGAGYVYNGSMEVKNSIVLNSLYKDAFSGQWNATAANAWIYETTALTATTNHPYFNVHNNYLSQPDPLHHPANTTWNAGTNGALIAPFMPVPGSNVGVAITSYAPAQSDTSAYPGTFTVRLSTFSSNAVSVDYSVIGKTDPFASAETILASGALNFAPGETLKTISPAVASPGNYGLIRVALTTPVNAEVTGEAWYFKLPATPSPTLVPLGATWKYLANGTNQGTAWRTVGFNDAAWPSGPAQLGYGGGTVAVPTGEGDEATIIPFIDTDAVTAGIQKNATTYFRRTFTVADASTITALNLSMIYDDGGVVYLNGQRVAATTTATVAIPIDPAFDYFIGGPTQENATLNTTVSPTFLVNGTNTIAVEIHQEVNTSSDISFDLQLTATYAQPFQLNLSRAAGQPVLYWFDSAAALEFSTDLGAWNPLPGSASPFPFSTGIPKEFFRLKK